MSVFVLLGCCCFVLVLLVVGLNLCLRFWYLSLDFVLFGCDLCVICAVCFVLLSFVVGV